MENTNLLKIIKSLPIIGEAIQTQTELRKASEKIDEKFRQMPRSSTCIHSEVPNGRTFCDYFQKCCIGYCNRCKNFDNRYLKGVAQN